MTIWMIGVTPIGSACRPRPGIVRAEVGEQAEDHDGQHAEQEDEGGVAALLGVVSWTSAVAARRWARPAVGEPGLVLGVVLEFLAQRTMTRDGEDDADDGGRDGHREDSRSWKLYGATSVSVIIAAMAADTGLHARAMPDDHDVIDSGRSGRILLRYDTS